MTEFIDIYDANLTPIGKMERIEAHREGQWHETFHCWVVTRETGSGGVLFQQRSATMKNFPGMLDVSAAGHLEAGESLREGIREIREELGIPIDEARLRDLGYRVEVADQSNGQKNREYQGVFMYETDVPLKDFRAEPSELSGLVIVPLADGMELFTGQRDALTVTGWKFEDPTSEQPRWSSFEQTITRDSFLPRIQRYYLTALIMADRMLAGLEPLAIS